MYMNQRRIHAYTHTSPGYTLAHAQNAIALVGVSPHSARARATWISHDYTPTISRDNQVNNLIFDTVQAAS